MKAATVSEIKTELANLQANELVDICIRLAKFKKENKELLTYLLFEAFDAEAYVDLVKADMVRQFDEINMASVYFIKKSLRKILRVTGKYIRFTGSADAEIRLLLFYCSQVKARAIPLETSPVISNLYQNQLKKINKIILTLHEDLQYDYVKELKLLT